ncbi:MAG: beta-lactamase family protein [Niabella sp.]|nr:beta-lactamase family protein [Niabella sp.]
MKHVLKNAWVLLGLTAMTFTACQKPGSIVTKGFDAALFAKNMRESLNGKTVGWSFAISQNGKIVQYDADGYARLSTNNPEVKYTYTTRQAIGSCSKTISALALLGALEAKGLDEYTYLADLLPSSWNIALENRKIRVMDMLTHKAGLTYFGNDYASLRKTMKTPTTGFGYLTQKKYDNVNYLLCRVLIPCVVNGKETYANMTDEQADEAVSQAHRDYVREKIFKVAGLPDWQKINIGPWNANGSITEAAPDRQMTMYYNYSQPLLPGIMAYTTYKDAGAGGWFINTPEMAQVLLTAEAGKYVSGLMLDKMKDLLMGYDGFVTGERGDYQWKNGYWYDDQKRGIFTVIMHFPNNVQIAWHTNSIQTDIGDPMGITGKAYDHAWR